MSCPTKSAGNRQRKATSDDRYLLQERGGAAPIFAPMNELGRPKSEQKSALAYLNLPAFWRA